MVQLSSIAMYSIAFLAIYVQVFFLVTFLEKRKHIQFRKGGILLDEYPAVTIIVPCWNEENTIDATVTSLRALDYPKDKLTFFLIDDGSTDSTWQKMQQYSNHQHIKIFHKSNGGKHTAMNMGIELATSEFVGCLDADSFVDPQALKRIMTYFASDHSTMAVVPSIVVHTPKTLIQKIQKVEYNWGVYMKKMLALVNGIHVTPGPFSIYRREIFSKIGLFKKAHNTEDMEIAYRMQKHHMKIEHCNDAFVFTVTPDTVKKLYKQRLRWIYGFIKNTIDYRSMLFSKNYGVFSWFTVPSGVISILGALTMFSLLLYNVGHFFFQKVLQVQAAGFSTDLAPSIKFDWFFVNTAAFNLITIVLYVLLIIALLLGYKIAEGKARLSITIIPFMVIYSVIAPLWILRAVWNTVTSRKTTWR
jgi:cellulose synthase/poly-beta-1,6-N-acetylglucosamine synthase-like glycosyltransferase